MWPLNTFTRRFNNNYNEIIMLPPNKVSEKFTNSFILTTALKESIIFKHERVEERKNLADRASDYGVWTKLGL